MITKLLYLLNQGETFTKVCDMLDPHELLQRSGCRSRLRQPRDESSCMQRPLKAHISAVRHASRSSDSWKCPFESTLGQWQPISCTAMCLGLPWLCQFEGAVQALCGWDACAHGYAGRLAYRRHKATASLTVSLSARAYGPGLQPHLVCWKAAQQRWRSGHGAAAASRLGQSLRQ